MCYAALIPVALTAASALAGTVNQHQQARSDNKMLEYNAQVSLNNAEAARQDARNAQYQARRNANEKRRETSVLIGAQRAKMGASGALAGSGSFLDIELDTAGQGEWDAMALIHEGDKEAWQHNVRVGQYEQQALSYMGSRKNSNFVLAGGLLSAGAQTGMAAGKAWAAAE